MRRQRGVDAIDFLMIAIAWVTFFVLLGFVGRAAYELTMLGWRLLS
jgi:hypothetical protein